MNYTTYTDDDWQVEAIIEKLPSGSGFDASWEHLKTQGNGFHVFLGHYHNLTEHGYYDGWTRLRLTVDPKDLGGFRLSLSGKARYGNREYFEDTIYYSLIQED